MKKHIIIEKKFVKWDCETNPPQAQKTVTIYQSKHQQPLHEEERSVWQIARKEIIIQQYILIVSVRRTLSQRIVFIFHNAM